MTTIPSEAAGNASSRYKLLQHFRGVGGLSTEGNESLSKFLGFE